MKSKSSKVRPEYSGGRVKIVIFKKLFQVLRTLKGLK